MRIRNNCDGEQAAYLGNLLGFLGMLAAIVGAAGCSRRTSTVSGGAGGVYAVRAAPIARASIDAGTRASPAPDTAFLTTDTRSTSFTDKTSRVAFLNRYIRFPTPVEDASYYIVYHDELGFPPGPSEWSISYAVKIAPGDLPRWTDMFQLVQSPSEPDLEWARTIAPTSGIWATSSKPLVYGRHEGRDYAIVFVPEGILFKLSRTLP